MGGISVRRRFDAPPRRAEFEGSPPRQKTPAAAEPPGRAEFPAASEPFRQRLRPRDGGRGSEGAFCGLRGGAGGGGGQGEGGGPVPPPFPRFLPVSPFSLCFFSPFPTSRFFSLLIIAPPFVLLMITSLCLASFFFSCLFALSELLIPIPSSFSPFLTLFPSPLFLPPSPPPPRVPTPSWSSRMQREGSALWPSPTTSSTGAASACGQGSRRNSMVELRAGGAGGRPPWGRSGWRGSCAVRLM